MRFIPRGLCQQQQKNSSCSSHQVWKSQCATQKRLGNKDSLIGPMETWVLTTLVIMGTGFPGWLCKVKFLLSFHSERFVQKLSVSKKFVWYFKIRPKWVTDTPSTRHRRNSYVIRLNSNRCVGPHVSQRVGGIRFFTLSSFPWQMMTLSLVFLAWC